MNLNLNYNVQAFYYPWFGNPEFDGEYLHWKHTQMGQVKNPKIFPGGDDIGADFYPQLGCYSCNDPIVIRQHMKWLRQAGIGTISYSWWGIDSFEDKALPQIMDIAAQFEIKVNFHLEPLPDRTAESTGNWVRYLLNKFGDHPAFWRDDEKKLPMFYVYDSYKTDAKDWAKLLNPKGKITIRNTEYDALFIGLWVEEDDLQFMLKSGFDGYYNYFATDGFTYGSSWKNWSRLTEIAIKNDMIFIPCIGPGYNDQRIRPWNNKNYRGRDEGKYFDNSWQFALQTKAKYIGITSFNEWHEGTQIEPAIPMRISEFQYEDYLPLKEQYYLQKTKKMIDKKTETECEK